MSKEDMRKVVILGTGGTIAGVGVPGLTTGYFSGGMDIESLITGVPGLKKLAWLIGEQIANVNSDDITQEDIQASFHDGILTLTIPKKEQKQVEQNKYIAIEG